MTLMNNVIYVRRKGDGRIVALRRRHAPILAVRAQDSPSAHCLDIRMLRELGVAFGYATLDSSWA
jgi:hypothetical protein